jgi:hypothetical protein
MLSGLKESKRVHNYRFTKKFFFLYKTGHGGYLVSFFTIKAELAPTVYKEVEKVTKIIYLFEIIGVLGGAHRDVQGGKFVLGKFLQWYRSYFCIKLLLVSLWPSKFPVKF